jgi:hypothetical protein
MSPTRATTSTTSTTSPNILSCRLSTVLTETGLGRVGNSHEVLLIVEALATGDANGPSAKHGTVACQGPACGLD